MTALGTILAGGRNRRYGDHKALAPVGGEPIIERVRRALNAVADGPVLIANEPSVYRPLGLPMRPDARPGTGVLGGIHTALLWARETDHAGALVAACDMPFIPSTLLERLLADAAATGADVVSPASRSRRGLEPLCAYYSTRCIAAIEAQFDREERRVVGFFPDVRIHRVPLDDVRALGDPAVIFMNVNTPAERDRAERLARAAAAGAADDG